MEIPRFTAETSLYKGDLYYRAASSGGPVDQQLVIPAFPWLRCLSGCLGCLGGGDVFDCVTCKNCAVCLFGLRHCPGPIWTL